MTLLLFSSRRRHTRCSRDWSSDVCSSDLPGGGGDPPYRRELSAIPGVYIPGGYRPAYAEPSPADRASGGFPMLRAIEPIPGFPARVAREVLDLRSLSPAPPVMLSGETELGGMSLVETSRGCPRMCGFCAAAHACPSFREFPLERVRAAVDAAWPHRTKVGLIGAAVLDS